MGVSGVSGNVVVSAMVVWWEFFPNSSGAQSSALCHERPRTMQIKSTSLTNGLDHGNLM